MIITPLVQRSAVLAAAVTVIFAKIKNEFLIMTGTSMIIQGGILGTQNVNQSKKNHDAKYLDLKIKK